MQSFAPVAMLNGVDKNMVTRKKTQRPMIKTHLIRAGITALAIILLATGCATTPVVSQQGRTRVSGVGKIALAPPVVEHIDAQTGNPLSEDESGKSTVLVSLITALRSALATKQVAVLEVTDIPGATVPEVAEDLGRAYSAIRRHSTSLDASLQERLSWIVTKTGTPHVMFCRYRLYSGPGGFWNPMNGAIASGSSRIVLDCHLYHTGDKRVLWTSSAQARASPSAGESSVSSIVPLVLETLEFE